MSGHSSPMVNRRGFLAAGVAGAAILGLRAPARAAQPLKVGLLLPLSGGLAREGQSCKRGADVTPALLADMGMPVQLMIADTETNIDTARTRAEKLIADGAQIMVCGGRDMAAGVMAALAEVMAPLGLDPATLKARGRYAEDVY